MVSKEGRGVISMFKVEKGYCAKRLVAGWLLLWNACCTRLTRLDLQTAKPAVVDVALRALTRTLIASNIIWKNNDWGLPSLWSEHYRQVSESVASSALQHDISECRRPISVKLCQIIYHIMSCLKFIVPPLHNKRSWTYYSARRPTQYIVAAD